MSVVRVESRSAMTMKREPIGGDATSRVHRGFEQFSRGTFETGCRSTRPREVQADFEAT
jgi:hypothetical protein